MTKLMISAIFAVFCFAQAVSAQVPLATQVAILKAEDARNFSALKAWLESKNEGVRARAILAAGRIGDAAAVPAVAAAMQNDSSARVREMAAFALGESEHDDAAPFIIRVLSDPKASLAVRARAVEAAGKIAAANADGANSKELGAAIVRVLKTENQQSGELGAKADALTINLGLTAALRARPDGAAEAVAPFVDYPNPEIVATALNTLARLRAKNVNARARNLVARHADPVVRANAARVLGAAEDNDATNVLIKVATGDSDSRVRVSAIRSLGALKATAAAEPLIKHGDQLLNAYAKAAKPNMIPAEQSETIEVATSLGMILQNSTKESSIALLERFRSANRYRSPEIESALASISPGRYVMAINLTIEGEGYVHPADETKKRYANWKVLSAIAQGIESVAGLEIADPKVKQNALSWLNGILETSRDPRYDRASFVLALPAVYRAIGAFKPANLGELAREALKEDDDVFVRVAAAELIGGLPVSEDNLFALNFALTYARFYDDKYNDALLATLDAMAKLDKRKSLPLIVSVAGYRDHIVRRKAFEILQDPEFRAKYKDDQMAQAFLKQADAHDYIRLTQDMNVAGQTRSGQVINTDTDYRRAAMRKNGSVKAVFTTAKGDFTIDLLPEDAPLTVDNFIKLANAKYFDGLEVHRVVANFVMQDGDPIGNGSGGPGWSIRCEVNMVPYGRGAVGMALSGKDTGGSQWFVTHSPQPHLDGGYTVFGQVNETDMKIVDNIVRGDKLISVRIIGK